jgi:aryl-alcohol dehydrogenase-like predicted oxidoreductase
LEVNGVLDVCRELGISIVAYSPLGRFIICINRGYLTGKIQNNSDIPEGDF